MAEAGPAELPLPDQKTIYGHILIHEDEPGPDDYDFDIGDY